MRRGLHCRHVDGRLHVIGDLRCVRLATDVDRSSVEGFFDLWEEHCWAGIEVNNQKMGKIRDGKQI